MNLVRSESPPFHFFVSSPLVNKNQETISSRHETVLEELLCQHCGGNGYTKSSPDCYHTCLNCFGKGILGQVS